MKSIAIFLEGGWTQKRLFDIDWSDASQCQACKKEERTENTGHTTAQNGTKSDEIPEVFRKLEQRARTSKKEWKWQRGIVEHPLSGSQWNRRHFTVRKWEFEKRKSWCLPAEGFKGHVATDGSLLGNAGNWGACVRAVVQLDYDEWMEPLHGMYVWLNGGRI